MDDAKGLFVFVAVFGLAIMFAVVIANVDEVTPIVAEAQAGSAIGTNTVLALEKGAAILLKLLVGATVAGVAAAVFAEARKAYGLWKRSARSGRWQGGPNARWQTTPKAPSEPRLTRQDLMLLLSGRQPVSTMARPGLGKTRAKPSDDDDELDVML